MDILLTEEDLLTDLVTTDPTLGNSKTLQSKFIVKRTELGTVWTRRTPGTTVYLFSVELDESQLPDFFSFLQRAEDQIVRCTWGGTHYYGILLLNARSTTGQRRGYRCVTKKEVYSFDLELHSADN